MRFVLLRHANAGSQADCVPCAGPFARRKGEGLPGEGVCVAGFNGRQRAMGAPSYDVFEVRHAGAKEA